VLGATGAMGSLCVPMLSGGRVVGALGIATMGEPQFHRRGGRDAPRCGEATGGVRRPAYIVQVQRPPIFFMETRSAANVTMTSRKMASRTLHIVAVVLCEAHDPEKSCAIATVLHNSYDTTQRWHTKDGEPTVFSAAGWLLVTSKAAN